MHRGDLYRAGAFDVRVKRRGKIGDLVIAKKIPPALESGAIALMGHPFIAAIK